jgi:hypothetical protein
MTSLSGLDNGVAWGCARAALRGQGIRGSAGLSHFVPGLWFAQTGSGFGSGALQGSFEDHAASTAYPAPITVSTTQTIKAIVTATGFTQSALGSATYTITTAAATPTFSPAAGTYAKLRQ